MKKNILLTILEFLNIVEIIEITRNKELCWQFENGVVRNYIADNTYITVKFFGKIIHNELIEKNKEYII